MTAGCAKNDRENAMAASRPEVPSNTSADSPSLWFRILFGGGALGPGKLDLMRRIEQLGSISAAARAMRMSHARSVKLVAEINALAVAPLVETRAGGEAGGGARLTKQGRRLLSIYEGLEEGLVKASAPYLREIAKVLGRD
jgi:molybdate transport system regulatory protein